METVNSPQPAVIRLLPLADLVDPDWNPRTFLDESEMQLLVDHMAAGGYIPPITVLKKDPSRPDAPWQVISGKRRREAARRLGWTQIEAIELDITLDAAQDLAISSNRDNKPYWLGEFLAVERRAQAKEGRKGVEIAAKIGWTTKRVSQALVLCRLLTPASRALILETAQKITVGNFSGGTDGPESAPKDPWTFSEEVAKWLIPLWDKENPPKSQEIADKAVRAILDRQLNGLQTKALVAQLLSGQDLAGFQPSPKGQVGKRPRSKAGHKTDAADQATQLPPGTGGQPQVGQPSAEVGATSVPMASPSPIPITAGVSGIAGGILWTQIKHIPGHILNRFFPRFTRFFNKTTAVVQRMGVKNQVWATFITLFLVLMVGSFLISMGQRLLTRMVYHLVYSRQVTPQPAARSRLSTEASAQVDGVGGSAHLTPDPQVRGQALVVPSRGAEGNGGTQMGSAPFSKSVSTAVPAPVMEQAASAVSQVQMPTPTVEKVKTQAAAKKNNQASASNPTTVIMVATPVPTKPQGEDPLGKVLSNAAGQGVSAAAGDAVRKLLPF